MTYIIQVIDMTDTNDSATIAEYLANGMSANERCSNFVDWFCSDKSLQLRAKGLDAKLKAIIASPRFNIDPTTWECFYKNCCPMVGNLYDYINVSPVNGDGEFYVITPKSGHVSENGLGDVWSSERGVIFTGTWKEIKQWLKG